MNVHRLFRRCFALFLCVSVLVLLTGCPMGMLVTRPTTFSGSDSMALPSPQANVLDKVIEAGEAMDFDVSSVDKTNQVIGFYSSEHPIVGYAIGKIHNVNLTVAVKDGGKRLEIGIMIFANLGDGDREVAQQIMDEFKAKFKEKSAGTS